MVIKLPDVWSALIYLKKNVYTPLLWFPHKSSSYPRIFHTFFTPFHYFNMQYPGENLLVYIWVSVSTNYAYNPSKFSIRRSLNGKIALP